MYVSLLAGLAGVLLAGVLLAGPIGEVGTGGADRGGRAAPRDEEGRASSLTEPEGPRSAEIWQVSELCLHSKHIVHQIPIALA